MIGPPCSYTPDSNQRLVISLRDQLVIGGRCDGAEMRLQHKFTKSTNALK